MNTRVLTAWIFSAAMLVSPCAAVATEPEKDKAAEKVVYHVDETINAGWAMMLARGHLDVNDEAHIVFVTFGPGIDFLLKGAKNRRGNAYADSVEPLMLRGVEFRMCEETLKARNIDRAKVIDGVTFVRSGAYEVVRLQQQEGYAYLKP